ncbi:hypothetical protein EP47_04440 [Legionella norrlandica]|uniref:Uncharacterized protein n=1 Tax=Legionella norrlandica TaxID=1498499 RepID=A0A0A2SR37_9GAMM|nr:hypothetical protein [Legionella norrlandica]KGP63217.1 hypothetical protein EP47_04440 [Legionella norrlandica]
MSSCIKQNILKITFLFLGLFLISTSSSAWYSAGIAIGFTGGNVHYHGDGIYPPWNNGYYYYGGRNIIVPNVIVPNVVINVPVQRVYVPVCEEMEVCDPYGQCWIEQFCR